MAFPKPLPEPEPAEPLRRGASPTAPAGLALSALCALSAVSAGVGTRLDVWDFRTGIAILKWSAEGAAAAALVCLAALWAGRRGPRRPLLLAVAGLLVALPAVALPWRTARLAARLPPIHDITTDAEDPPAFVALRALRAGAANPPEYGGPEVAAAQRAAYPDIRPDRLPVPPAEAFRRALAASRALGWRIAAADEPGGRIEATDTTFWFGFKDDVVIRVRPDDGGSRVDARSVSRVGKSDIGRNARRLREFLARL